ncbi:pyruvoyl-dependent arginine decarboxylase [Halosegnis marinus]|uniref:arginine decarboxylase n=1 Tax=Halosegnis marinus TaxID=3034023 RepID=A0ABD5ZPE1_9EURY|nr:pyruvoyl-dependent arginine decarboxylase [Halosegnis sp. DT85]
MEPIRVVWGTGTAPTEMASYDAALADAGVENYNLAYVSSVVPAGATVAATGTAPDLGPVGERLTVVQARETVPPGERATACAGLGWSQAADGKGLFYEASGRDPDAVEAAVRDGLAAGESLRAWAFEARDDRLETAAGDPEAYTTAVVLAAYGESEPLL